MILNLIPGQRPGEVGSYSVDPQYFIIVVRRLEQRTFFQLDILPSPHWFQFVLVCRVSFHLNHRLLKNNLFQGGLFAGATAGGNVRASAGLAGAAGAERAAGSGYASASGGGHEAASGLVGDTYELARRRELRKEEKRWRKEQKKAQKAAAALAKRDYGVYYF